MFHNECLKKWKKASRSKFECLLCSTVVLQDDPLKKGAVVDGEEVQWILALDDIQQLQNAICECEERQDYTYTHPVYGPIEKWNVSNVTEMDNLFLLGNDTFSTGTLAAGTLVECG